MTDNRLRCILSYFIMIVITFSEAYINSYEIPPTIDLVLIELIILLYSSLDQVKSVENANSLVRLLIIANVEYIKIERKTKLDRIV